MLRRAPPWPWGWLEGTQTQPGAAEIWGESRVGLPGFPDAPMLRLTQLLGAPEDLPSLPFAPTCLPIACRLHQWSPGALRSSAFTAGLGSGSRVPQAQALRLGSPGLCAGARVTLRRGSERWMCGPASWRSEQRQVSPFCPPPPSATSFRRAPLGEGERVPELRF